MLQELPGRALDAFHSLHKRALQVAGKLELDFSQQSRRGRESKRRRFLVYQLAYVVENTDEFDELVLALFELVRPAQEPEEPVEPPSNDELKRGARVLQELLKRSGYFHAILENESPEPYWEKIAERARGGGYEVVSMLLLDRFGLPESYFERTEDLGEGLALGHTRRFPVEIAGWENRSIVGTQC